jgi:hypothetical protein
MAYLDSCDKWIDERERASDSVASLNRPFSWRVQLTGCQGDDEAGICLQDDTLFWAAERGLSIVWEPFHSKDFPILMMESELWIVLSDTFRRPFLLGSIPELTEGAMAVSSPFLGRMGCQQSRAASQESKVSGTAGLSCTTSSEDAVDTLRYVPWASASYKVRTLQPRRSDIRCLAWAGFRTFGWKIKLPDATLIAQYPDAHGAETDARKKSIPAILPAVIFMRDEILLVSGSMRPPCVPLSDLELLDPCAGGEDTRAGGFAWRCRVSF